MNSDRKQQVADYIDQAIEVCVLNKIYLQRH